MRRPALKKSLVRWLTFDTILLIHADLMRAVVLADKKLVAGSNG
jgi:hypothetical protein